jgi:hypothetical protein
VKKILSVRRSQTNIFPRKVVHADHVDHILPRKPRLRPPDERKQRRGKKKTNRAVFVQKIVVTRCQQVTEKAPRVTKSPGESKWQSITVDSQ